MKRPKGPELKMPDVSVPPFLADLFYDLRDRRLLPLVVLVVVAIAAVPFLLGGSEKPLPPATPGGATAVASEALDASSLTVVEAKPGLREYRKRLAGRSPTDPFKQHYTAPNLKGAELPEPESSSSSSTVTTGGSNETTITSETTSTTTSPGGAPPSGGGKPHLVLFDYAIDARISYSPPEGQDGAQQQEPFVEHRVLPQTPLPGEKAPVVTYMGPGRKKGNKATGKVLLLVSADVQSISGEHRCVASSQTGGVCQLLEVEPGFPLTFAYGEGGAHYTIKVLSIELVVTGHT